VYEILLQPLHQPEAPVIQVNSVVEMVPVSRMYLSVIAFLTVLIVQMKDPVLVSVLSICTVFCILSFL